MNDMGVTVSPDVQEAILSYYLVYLLKSIKVISLHPISFNLVVWKYLDLVLLNFPPFSHEKNLLLIVIEEIIEPFKLQVGFVLKSSDGIKIN